MAIRPRNISDFRQFDVPLGELNKIKLDVALSSKNPELASAAQTILQQIKCLANILYGNAHDRRYKAIVDKAVQHIIESLPNYFDTNSFKKDVLAKIFSETLTSEKELWKTTAEKVEKIEELIVENKLLLDELKSTSNNSSIQHTSTDILATLASITKKIDSVEQKAKILTTPKSTSTISKKSFIEKTASKTSLIQKIGTTNTKHKTLAKTAPSILGATTTLKKPNLLIKALSFLPIVRAFKVITNIGKITKVLFKGGLAAAKLGFKMFGSFVKNFIIVPISCIIKGLWKMIKIPLTFVMDNIKNIASFVGKGAITILSALLLTPQGMNLLGKFVGIIWFKILKPVIGKLTPVFNWIKENMEPIWNTVKTVINWVYDNIVKAAATHIYDKYIAPVLDMLFGPNRGDWTKLKDTIFNNLVGDIKTIYEKISNMWTKYKTPIVSFMMKHVIDPLKIWLAGGEKNTYIEGDRAKYSRLTEREGQINKLINDLNSTLGPRKFSDDANTNLQIHDNRQQKLKALQQELKQIKEEKKGLKKRGLADIIITSILDYKIFKALTIKNLLYIIAGYYITKGLYKVVKGAAKIVSVATKTKKTITNIKRGRKLRQLQNQRKIQNLSPNKSPLKQVNPIKQATQQLKVNHTLAQLPTNRSTARFADAVARRKTQIASIFADNGVKVSNDVIERLAKTARPNKVLKEIGEIVAKRAIIEGAEKTATTMIAKGGAKIIAQTGGKALTKSLVKKIPLVGAIFGAGLAISRAMDGDWSGAGLELASGLVSTIPGIGTAVSAGLDAALFAKDGYQAYQALKGSQNPVPNLTPQPPPTQDIDLTTPLAKSNATVTKDINANTNALGQQLFASLTEIRDMIHDNPNQQMAIIPLTQSQFNSSQYQYAPPIFSQF